MVEETRSEFEQHRHFVRDLLVELVAQLRADVSVEIAAAIGKLRDELKDERTAKAEIVELPNRSRYRRRGDAA